MKLNTTSLATCISACMLLGLTACGNDSKPVDPKPPVVKPEPKSLEITITTQGVVETFKSLSFTAKASNTTNDVSYSWNFGDESSVTGANVKHTYGKAGDYTVVLTATDMKTKKTVTTNEKITVNAKASSNEAAVVAKITDTTGKALSGITVKVDGKTQTTNALGFVTYQAVNTMDKTLVSATADGYTTQSIQLDPSKSSDSRSVTLKLKKQNPMQVITDISATNTLKQGKMTVTFEKDSFVTADGKAVTGKADISITQWDPTNAADMAGFLGDGVAIDSNGEYGQLQSYGAMTVNFTQNGKKLQLAPGKYADISMPLPLAKDYDGSDMKVGDTIPMWHFAESTGAWIQEADLMGTVVADAAGKLKLEAQVSHFTTWNWDMKMENPTSMFVKCELSDGKAVPCFASVSFKYLNGAMLGTRQNDIPVDGVKIIDIDPNLNKVTFTAVYYDVSRSIYHEGEVTINPSSGTATVVLDKRMVLDFDASEHQPEFFNISCSLPEHNCNGIVIFNYHTPDNNGSMVKPYIYYGYMFKNDVPTKMYVDRDKKLFAVTFYVETYWDKRRSLCYPGAIMNISDITKDTNKEIVLNTKGAEKNIKDKPSCLALGQFPYYPN